MVAGTSLDPSLTLHKLLIADQNLAPLRHHPDADEFEYLTEEFTLKHDLMFAQFKGVNNMTSYMYPDAALERVTWTNKLMALLFHIDDVYADNAESKGMKGGAVAPEILAKIERSAVAFETGWLPPHSGGLEQAFQELRLEIQDTVEPEWMIRFSQVVRQHITYAINPQAFGWKPDGNVPYERYAWLREVISGMYLAIDLIEYVNDFVLLPHVVYHPTIRRLQQACSRIAAFANDLFSYEREVLQEGLRFNLLAVLQRTQNLSFPEAVQLSIEITNHETEEFFRLSNEIAIWDDTTNALIQRYVECMKYHVSATWHWQMNTIRYRSTTSPFMELIKPLIG